MDFIKKKPLLTLSLVIAVLLAAFLAVKIKQASASARESGKEIERLKQFGIKEANAKYSATAENLAISEANLTETQEQLLALQKALYEASHVEFNRNVSNTQCKNQLFEGTAKFVNDLASQGIDVTESSKYFSFASVINAEKLPDEEFEVPVLMKQLRVVGEIVEILKTSQITQLVSLDRLKGVGVAEKKPFKVMPLAMQVRGSSSSVMAFLSQLQKDSNYYFVIRKVTFKSQPPAINGRKAGAVGGGTVPSTFPDSPGTGKTSSEGAEGTGPDVPFAEQFEVQFADIVTADIRFDFVEFKNPVEEN